MFNADNRQTYQLSVEGLEAAIKWFEEAEAGKKRIFESRVKSVYLSDLVGPEADWEVADLIDRVTE
jgi:hypothetical protein